MPADEQSHRAPPEEPDVATRPVLIVAFGFMLFAALSGGGLFLKFRKEFAAPLIPPPRAFPQPELQQDPSDDLARLLARQREHIQDYAWVDKEAGIIRIPIEDAMKLVAAKGPDGFAPLEQPAEIPAPGSRGRAGDGGTRPPGSAPRDGATTPAGSGPEPPKGVP